MLGRLTYCYGSESIIFCRAWSIVRRSLKYYTQELLDPCGPIARVNVLI